MKGWHQEPARHSLASRGIKTRAIMNPIASPELDVQEVYTKRGRSPRKYIGSGIDKITVEQVVDQILPIFDHLKKDTHEMIEDYDMFLEDSIRPYDTLGVDIYRVREILDEIYTRGFEIEEIYLYGSRVTGFYDPRPGMSDLDVAVVLKYDQKLANLFDELAYETYDVEMNLEKRISYFVWMNREWMGSVYGFGYDLHVKDKDGIRIDIDLVKSGFEPPENVNLLKIWEARS